MTSEEKFPFWLEHAEYDLEAAESMFQSGKWVYVVFMCQQAIEKLVKGLYLLYLDEEPPKIHDINRLLSKFEGKLPEEVGEEKVQLFSDLGMYYLNTRYPEYKRELYLKTSRQVAENFLKRTKESYQWLMTLSPLKDSSGSTLPT
ncbi:MAG: HEPN domain-containing protein [Planctomycetaceae bacterium]|jgi:HEPN domain-containing protein|nr:HEPN domain-containing protein [Planctomycetaceae bacterium]